jgi:hypothetical protein
LSIFSISYNIELISGNGALRVRLYRQRIATSCGQSNRELEKARIKQKKNLAQGLVGTLPTTSVSISKRNTWYDASAVNKLRLSCIKYGVIFDEKLKTHSESLYISSIAQMSKAIAVQLDHEKNGLKKFLPFNAENFSQLSPVDQLHYISSHEHELSMFQLSHKKCSKCMSVSIVKDYTQNRTASEVPVYTCSECKNRNNSDFFFKEGCNKLLPVWYDDNHTVHYEQPHELKILRLGEQLLIQRFSVFVPVIHIRNGIMGLKGHCCCFSQDVSEVANSLPRTSANVVVVTKGTVDKSGNALQQSFSVRKVVVMNALRWLKKYHKWYRDDPDLVINEDNLSWMNGRDEADMVGIKYVNESDEDQIFSNGVVSGINDTTFLEGVSGTLKLLQSLPHELSNRTYSIS